MIEIEGIKIGQGEYCYVIAEIGNNHQGSVDICKKMILAAKQAGAQAVKLQKRDNKSLYTKALYNSPYENENSYGKTYGEHREFLEFNLDQYKELQAYAKEVGITFFATAFDISSADFLHSLDVPCYKIASGDLTNTQLIKHVASFGKPVIISTGGAKHEAIMKSIAGINEFILLHCIAEYPAKIEHQNLSVIETLIDTIDNPGAVIGFSNHYESPLMPLLARTFGADVIETHFTLDRAWKGTDHAFSLEPQGLAMLCEWLKRYDTAAGDGIKKQYEEEKKPLYKMAKGIWPVKRIPAGDVITSDKIALKSPSGGLPAYEWNNIIGRIVINEISSSAPIKEGDLE